MLHLLSRFADDSSGATAIEYGLIASIVSVALVSILGALGGNLATLFTKISDALATVQ
ncbi:Flp family type IVb pilin [Aureimonas sp. Leaf454]|uniref:Flp family type IVb pilin n=1 Tax=Aureimonas sp. Leaf454 TaxID=1736381 RepID=UPI0009EA4A5A|nr:Flp family type IVb pilin [Aureimonas sp. Leaf454]